MAFSGSIERERVEEFFGRENMLELDRLFADSALLKKYGLESGAVSLLSRGVDAGLVRIINVAYTRNQHKSTNANVPVPTFHGMLDEDFHRGIYYVKNDDISLAGAMEKIAKAIKIEIKHTWTSHSISSMLRRWGFTHEEAMKIIAIKRRDYAAATDIEKKTVSASAFLRADI